MPTVIRLTRQGRKKTPVYHIVVADSRYPRDGRYIERLGLYKPSTNPATVELQFERALHWVQVGAQPSDTCRSILSEKGVMMKKHLIEGIKKNALTAEQVEQKFQAWMQEKEQSVIKKLESLNLSKSDIKKQKLAAESKVKEKRAAELAKKFAAAAAAAAPAPVAQEAPAAEEVASATEETPQA